MLFGWLVSWGREREREEERGACGFSGKSKNNKKERAARGFDKQNKTQKAKRQKQPSTHLYFSSLSPCSAVKAVVLSATTTICGS